METVPAIIYKCTTLLDLEVVSKKILEDSKPHKLFLLFGEMGAGKTTLIKEFCKQLGVKDMVASPTYTLLNEYLSSDGFPIYHFDFYRLKSESEAFDLGYENYFYSGNYCFVEWPERITSLLPNDAIKIYIETEGETRILKLHL
ncbi:MAG: tRNA (adenosine(37)-N6)-threonylcarbamoyltransferase complex ATPase subunit type 1 TsaE [Bacteroidetes bacterium]|nr:tRNA (adenosine(37)-N6)-threonylcarbamoyltransferase complex ATPase subunit type 1 TsaE [Bacteroidota bacterium]